MIEKMENDAIPHTLIELTKQFLIESGEPFHREIKLDASLQRNLGIDSLGRAELFGRIEKKFNISFPDHLLAEAETLNDIAEYIYQAKPGIKKVELHEMLASHGQRPHLDPSQTHSLIEMLFLYGENAADKAHIYYQNEEGHEEIITYGLLLQSSLQVAYALRQLGLKDGETVAIMQPTNPGFFYTFFGTLLAGGIPVPIYPPFRMHMLEVYAKTEAHILRSAEVRILVTFEQAEKLSRLLQGFVPSLKRVVTVHELMQARVLTKTFAAKPDDFAFIQYTSGSTAEPKGVLLTHYNLLTNIRAYGKSIRAAPDDVVVSWLPLYHDMGLIGMWLGSLYHGVPLVLLAPFTFLNRPERWLWAIHYHRGTISGAPNFAYELCIRKIESGLIEGIDLSSWRLAANGAEKVYPRTLEEFAKKFAPFGFKRRALRPVYGLAESTVALAILSLDRDFHVDYVDRKKFEEERKAMPTSNHKGALAFVDCGAVIDGHGMRIVDDNNHELPERHVGNLQFTGPSSMQGYYNNPQATALVYHDGWIDTGDLAYLADGEVYITGRRKDLIIKAGRNIYPAEIEENTAKVPGVRQGCVVAFGVTDNDRGTEQLIIVAETREKNHDKRAKIRDDIREAISKILDIVPDHIVLVAPNTVPKTSSGKLQRARCKKMYMNGQLGKRHVPTWLQITKITVQSLVRKTAAFIYTCGKFIYSLYVAIVFVLTLLPVYVIVRLSTRDIAARAMRFWAQFLVKAAFCRLKVNGKGHLNEKTPVIYTANHASYMDTVVLLAVLPPNTRFVGKKELLKVPVIKTFISKLGFLVVDRFDLPKGIEDTRAIEETLKQGFPVMIFPEGTFAYASGLRPFRLGAFKIAVETKVAVCPVALQGTRYILRNSEKLMQPGRVNVTITAPIMPQGMEWQDVIALRSATRREIAKHCGEPLLDFIAAQKVAAPPI